jgi:hypothetical protein
VIAETLALALVVLAPGARSAAVGWEARADNATRARRGLLPRKAARSPVVARGRRVMLLPSAPTWLGEPAVPDENPQPWVEAAAFEPREDREAPAALRAAVEGVDVALLVVRRAPSAQVHPLVRAEVEGVEVGAVLLRRLRREPR